jgi:hypothetical protein
MTFTIYSSRPWMAAAGAALYAWLACLCALTWRQAHRRGLLAEARWWGVLAAGQLFCTADAAFGIRMAVAEIGRRFSVQQDWYEYRGYAQAILSAAVLLAIIAGWVVSYRIRKGTPGVRLALGGMLLSLLLFLIAGISMHRLENLLAWPFEPLAPRTSLRVLASGLTAAGAWLSLRRYGSAPTPPE